MSEREDDFKIVLSSPRHGERGAALARIQTHVEALEGERLRLLHELLATLDRDFAQVISPADAWSDALLRVGALVAHVEALADDLATALHDKIILRSQLGDAEAHVEALEAALREIAKNDNPVGTPPYVIARAALAGEPEPPDYDGGGYLRPSEPPTTCPTCGSDERKARLPACQEINQADPWHTVPTGTTKEEG